jgi:hypothetical protein
MAQKIISCPSTETLQVCVECRRSIRNILIFIGIAICSKRFFVFGASAGDHMDGMGIRHEDLTA